MDTSLTNHGGDQGGRYGEEGAEADGSAGRGAGGERGDFRSRYERLVGDPDFLKKVSSGTTDQEVLKSRFQAADEALFAQ